MVVYQKPAFVSRSHLLRLAVLSQHVVDYATKAYELRDTSFGRQLYDAECSLREIQSAVAERGRALRGAGNSLDAETVSGACTLQIYSGLQITFAAAREIAQNVSRHMEKQQSPDSAPAPWAEAARFANSLVSLNAAALLNKQAGLAKLVMQARRDWEWPGQMTLHACEKALRQGNSAFEECVARCLDEVVEQAFDIASAITRLLGSENCGDTDDDDALPSRSLRSRMPSSCLPYLEDAVCAMES